MRFAAFLFAATLAAQQAPAPAASGTPVFDVVSIHPVPPNAPPIMRDMNFTPVLPGGQFINSRTPLLFMIAIVDHVDPNGHLSAKNAQLASDLHRIAIHTLQVGAFLPAALLRGDGIR